jgi:hypothetical protein
VGLWVFDQLVVTRVNRGDFVFYEKPMIQGLSASPVTLNKTETTYNKTITAFDWD